MEKSASSRKTNHSNSNFFTIGFLSNITIEKGIQDFISTSNHIPDHLNNIKFIIAGPTKEPAVINEIEQFVKADPKNRFWLGPIYGEEKQAFFDEIDILLFPTRYKMKPNP